MMCTYVVAKGQCNSQAVIALRWYTVVAPGWAVTNDRVYCKPHGDETLGRLNAEGVTVAVETIQVPIFPVVP